MVELDKKKLENKKRVMCHQESQSLEKVHPGKALYCVQCLKLVNAFSALSSFYPQMWCATFAVYKVGQSDISSQNWQRSQNCVSLSLEWMLQIQGWPFLAVNMTKLSDILSKVLIQNSKANALQWGISISIIIIISRIS